MFKGLVASIMRPGGARADARTAVKRGGSVDAAVGWWEDALRAHGAVDAAALEAFGSALRTDLTARLDTTYRVYLEAAHEPKGILRTAALAAGLDLGSFPPATTMSVSDAKVEVSTATASPYELIHTAS